MFSMRLTFAACAMLLSLSVAAGEPFRPLEVAPGTILPARCHMGECAWTRVISSSSIVRTNQDLVVKLNQQVGSSEEGSDQITWDTEVASTITCSYARPQVSFVYEGERNDHNLNLSPQGIVFGYQVSSVLSYFRACHNLTLGEGDIDGAIKRFGYDVISDE